MKLYRYSPLKNESECLEALRHIDSKLRALSDLVLDEKLPINTLKIFAHYQEEYGYLRQWADSLGESENEGSATSYYVKPTSPVTVNGDPIEYIGVRVPDPYRSQVGCGDYVVKNFDELRLKYLSRSAYVREVPHQKYQMLELFHPDIDVLGYIVKNY